MATILKVGGPTDTTEYKQVSAVAAVAGCKLRNSYTKSGDEHKKVFLSMSPFGAYPCMDTIQGTIIGPSACAIYIAQMFGAAKLLDGTNYQLSKCVSVMEQCNNVISKSAEQYLAYLDVYFSSWSYLVGERMSVADIYVAVAIKQLDGIDIPINVQRWMNCIFSDNRIVKAIQVRTPGSPKKGAQSPKASPKVVSEPVPPPTFQFDATVNKSDFNLMEWKKTYSNSKDLRGETMPWFMKENKENFTFWKVKYDKVEGECEKDYLTSNLLNGFIQSMPTEARKFGFGVFMVTGAEPDFNYEGVLMLLGNGKDEMPHFMVDHRSYEYHHWTPLNIGKEADKNYIMDVLCNDVDEKLDGRNIADVKQFK